MPSSAATTCGDSGWSPVSMTMRRTPLARNFCHDFGRLGPYFVAQADQPYQRAVDGEQQRRLGLPSQLVDPLRRLPSTP